jgi:predicted metal-dependent HD superfamily phosphohydrolase
MSNSVSLEKAFKEELQLAGAVTSFAIELWLEIEHRYGEPHRHYHNLAHLDFVWEQLRRYEGLIENPGAIVFAVCYHDIVYDPKRGDNEDLSAELAKERLAAAGIEEGVIAKCNQLIMATKGHTVSDDPEVNLFTDADLSILGQEKGRYFVYAAQVRNEYAHIGETAWQQGRAGVLQRFLRMERIFKTGVFHNDLEQLARENLHMELELLAKKA